VSIVHAERLEDPIPEEGVEELTLAEIGVHCDSRDEKVHALSRPGNFSKNPLVRLRISVDIRGTAG